MKKYTLAGMAEASLSTSDQQLIQEYGIDERILKLQLSRAKARGFAVRIGNETFPAGEPEQKERKKRIIRKPYTTRLVEQEVEETPTGEQVITERDWAVAIEPAYTQEDLEAAYYVGIVDAGAILDGSNYGQPRFNVAVSDPDTKTRLAVRYNGKEHYRNTVTFFLAEYQGILLSDLRKHSKIWADKVDQLLEYIQATSKVRELAINLFPESDEDE